jgi:branched-subunit amino acid ABC-type transport system permease component
MTQFISVVVGGLTLGAVYFLIAVGVTVVFGQTRIVNFAHGQFLIIAGLITWSLQSAGVGFLLAVPIAVAAVALLTLIVERTILRNVAQNPLGAFIITLGLLIILQQLCVEIWGPSTKQLDPPLTGSWTIGDVEIPYTSPALIIPALIIGGGLLFLFRYTDAGRQARACAEDSYAAAHLGVRVTRVSSLVFVGGTALAALAGCALAMVYPLSPFDGGSYILKGFSIALVGGLGSISGAGIAAVAFGLLETAGQAYWLPEWVPALSFALIIITLLIRPSGLLGRSALSTESVVAMVTKHIPAPRWAPYAFVILAVLAFFVPSMGLSAASMGLASIAVVNAAQAAAVGALFRMSGVLSFAHGAFLGVGGFFAAYAAARWELGFWLSLPIVFAVCTVMAAVIAVPVFRTRGLYFLIVAFAVTDAVALAEANWTSVTGGSNGLTLLTPPESVFGLDFTERGSLYRLFLVMTLTITLACWLVARSGFGDRLLAIRDNEILARSLGLPVRRYLVTWFAITGGISGIAGVMFLYETLAVAPLLFSGLATVFFPIMVILGGTRSVAGPIVGAALLAFLPHWLNLEGSWSQVFYGAVLIIVMLALPQGVVPSLYLVIDRITGRVRGGRAGSVSATAPPGAGVREGEPVTSA